MGSFFPVLVMLFPIAEVLVTMRVAARIGFWDTLFLLICFGFLGAYLAKVQGQITLQRIQQCLREGQMPTREMLDGVLVFIGGLLFVFPGFISDFLGLLLIFPWTRWVIRALVGQGLRSNLQAHQTSAKSPEGRKTPEKPAKRGDVTDAEIVE